MTSLQAPHLVADTELEPTEGSGPEDFAHYTQADGVVDAIVEGREVVALCGYRFVPSRDPNRFPVCPPCQRLNEDAQ